MSKNCRIAMKKSSRKTLLLDLSNAKRISIKFTRTMINSILNNDINKTTYIKDSIFGLDIIR